MRQIKFRALDKEAKCWVPQDQIAITGEGVIYTRDGNDDIDTEAETGDAFIREVIKLEIVFFTGLLDKNGKEIYEGDIVKAKDFHPENYVISFLEGGFGATLNGVWMADINQFYDSTGCCIEIIGNIYENPELLEAQGGER